jgi:hypothetical protein
MLPRIRERCRLASRPEGIRGCDAACCAWRHVNALNLGILVSLASDQAGGAEELAGLAQAATGDVTLSSQRAP